MTDAADSRAARALDAVFRHHGRAAVWTPAGGAPVEIRLLTRSPDALYSPMGAPAVAENPVVEIRVAEAPALKKGDTLSFAVAGEPAIAWRVHDAVKADGRRLKWKVELKRV